jgi:hypothetical protein
MRKSRLVVLVGLALMVTAALACGPAATETPPIAPTITMPPEVGGITPTVSPPEPTSTTPPDVSGPGGCAFNAAFVADMTVPDNTPFAPGTPFVKTWRLRNSGTCAWEAGTMLVFISGDALGGPTGVAVGAVAPGATTDVSVNLTAPSSPGTYKGNWQLQRPDGTRFGAVVYVQIVVAVTPTVPPAGLPDLRVTDLTFDPTTPTAGTPFHVRAVLHNSGSTALSNVTVRIENRLPTPHTTCYYPSTFNTLYQTTVSLNPGQSLPVDYLVTINEVWHHFVCIKIDPDDVIAETNEDNNAQGQEVSVESGECTTMDPFLEPVVSVASGFGVNPGCPTASSISVYGAFQKFETNPENPNPHARMGAFMIWRSDTRRIYALGFGSESGYPTQNGRWLSSYNDLWDESQPSVHPDCASMTAPTGYQLPVRGFGKVWCENGLWASDRLGWPRDREWAVSLLLQPTQNGWLIRVIDYPDGYDYVFALDLMAQRWASIAVAP